MARLHGVETDYASLRRMLLGNYTLDNEDEYEQVRELLAERDRLREALEELLRWQPQTKIGRKGLHPQHRAAVEAAEALSRPENERG